MNKYESLNDKQQEAVKCTEGSLLILAGAGSGKTRVLTHRIAYLIEEKGVNPWNIMAITFTNKAAKEMRNRVDKLVGFGSESIWVATFHSTCVRILRRFIDRIGYENNFSIYDADDQKATVRRAIKKLDLDTKLFKERPVMSMISSAKNEMITPEDLEKEAEDIKQKKNALIYKEYQKCLRENNALDFDDLLVKTVELFLQNPDVLEYYQKRFRYIMVDEYQDTNNVQFQFIRILAEKYKNLCVVGDDDQSIYRFRGADIRNILGFEEAFPGTKVVKLEQNYRSTTSILNAANEIIKNNLGRKEKRLWSDKTEGEKVKFRRYENGYDEADAVVRMVKQTAEEDGGKYSDCAILYRTNAQSRPFEEKCIVYNVPYRLIGGINFYQRQEIKDILAYLRTIDNGRDDLSVRRIVNVPKRGIGQTTIERIQTFADEHEISFFAALENASEIPGLRRAEGKLNAFVNQIHTFRTKLEDGEISELIETILEETKYIEELEDNLEREKAQQKKENIDEFINKAAEFEENDRKEEGADEEKENKLSRFLEEVALVADIDSMDNSDNRLSLMTLHSAKGLEFPRVFLCGMEEGLFPSYLSIYSGEQEDLEEERRLCYVGITRAMDYLMLTSAKSRMTRGETQRNCVSRFIDEIPEELLDCLAVEKLERNSVKKEEEIPLFEKFRSGFGGAHSNIFDLPKKNSAVDSAKPIHPSVGKPFTVVKADSLEYSSGDTVKHIKFGVGKVLEIEEGKRDFEVTVEFEEAGVKRMFASFAKLQKL